MSDVKRYDFGARVADGSTPLYVRASDYDALAAENAALRKALQSICGAINGGMYRPDVLFGNIVHAKALLGVKP
jgi:hypothetical protein